MGSHDALLRPGLVLVAGAFAVLALGGLVTTWDGAWFIARLLETGTPTFLHGRLIGWTSQAPAIIVRWLGGDAWVVATALGIGIAAFPCVSVLAAWRICGPDRRPLVSFVVLGIGLAALPGLAFATSEAFLAVCLGWPIIVAAALGRIGRHRWLVASLAAGSAISHPFAVPLLAAAAVAAALSARREAQLSGTAVGRRERRAALVLASLAGALALRYLLVPSLYEADTLSLSRLGDHFRGGVSGRPLVAVGLTWALGAWLLIRPGRDRLGVLVIAGLSTAILVVLVPWALDVARWERALMFRTWLLAAQAPLIAMLMAAAIRAQVRPPSSHGLAIAGTGVVAVTVLLLQSIAWRAERDALVAAIAQEPAGCIRIDALGLQPSALDHWGVTALVYLAEAPTPRHLVLADEDCAAIEIVGGVPSKVIDGAVLERLSGAGWFDTRVLDAALADQP